MSTAKTPKTRPYLITREGKNFMVEAANAGAAIAHITQDLISQCRPANGGDVTAFIKGGGSIEVAGVKTLVDQSQKWGFDKDLKIAAPRFILPEGVTSVEGFPDLENPTHWILMSPTEAWLVDLDGKLQSAAVQLGDKTKLYPVSLMNPKPTFELRAGHSIVNPIFCGREHSGWLMSNGHRQWEVDLDGMALPEAEVRPEPAGELTDGA